MKKILFAIIALGFSVEAFGYGAAGCGIGSMLFEGKNQWYEQVLAATTNGTSGNQTFGITFGSLNCDANKLAKKEERATIFVSANKNAVMNELAMGSGESVSVLSEILECSNNVQFGNMMKSNYSKIVTDSDLSAEQIVDNMNRVIQSNNACSSDLG